MKIAAAAGRRCTTDASRTMDLMTNYLGMKLRSPLVPSASPLSEEVDNIKRMEDAGAAAVVLHSIFEEQLTWESHELHHHLTHGTESFAESLTFFPEPEQFHVGPETYLEHIRQAKDAVDIPLIASLNGSSVGAWTSYARQIEQAGPDALELNIYSIPTDPNRDSAAVEADYLEIVREVRAAVSIPLAVKLSPFFSSFASMARRLVDVGADALVLFNRFYQPDIDVEELEVRPSVILSTQFDLRLPLCWIGLLKGRIKADLAATGGVHTAEDVVKMVMVGADVTMMCSALLQHGIDHLRNVEKDLRIWIEDHQYESLAQMKGSLSQEKCPDPAEFERAQYMRALHEYRPGPGTM